MSPAPTTRPWWPWLLLVPALLGILRLRFDTEILHLLPAHLPSALGLKIHQEYFSNARELIVTVDAATPESAETTAGRIAAELRRHPGLVAHVQWQPPWIESPSDAFEIVATTWLNAPPQHVESLARRLAPAHLPLVLAEAQETLASSLAPDQIGTRAYDPFGLTLTPGTQQPRNPAANPFASEDGSFRVLYVRSAPDLSQYTACRSWLADIQDLLSRAAGMPAVTNAVSVGVTGRPAFVTEIAGGMEKDMAGSCTGTLGVIAVLFFLTHRRLRPLFLLLLFLMLILGVTLATGGLLLGTLNVVSVGFAAILAGLAEDFAVVIYQEHRSHPQLPASEIRRLVTPGIAWSALTTAGAFLLLNLSTLPGLGQLGTLVAIGVLAAAVLMIGGFLPAVVPAIPPCQPPDPHPEKPGPWLLFSSRTVLPVPVGWVLTAALTAVILTVTLLHGIPFDTSPNVLRPVHSPAADALARLRSRLGLERDPAWLILRGSSPEAVGRQLEMADAFLGAATSNGLVSHHELPLALWPIPDRQRSNLVALDAIVASGDSLFAAATNAGFTADALAGTRAILGHWRAASAGVRTGAFWPGGASSRWLLDRTSAYDARSNEWFALGLIHTPPHPDALRNLVRRWADEFPSADALLSGWEILGSTVFDTVTRELPFVLAPIALLVIVSLVVAFRNFRDVVLCLFTLAFSGAALAAAMSLLGWSWNLLNLMALPLLLGMGVDFSIHIQLALRRLGGHRRAVHASVSRALLLAGTTTVAGFASLAFSSNAGMASLGKVCALGIALTLAVSIHLLPVWWCSIVRVSPPGQPPPPAGIEAPPVTE